MALKSMFSAMKREGYIIKDLDLYLLSLNDKDSDRAINVNAPSQVGTCMRSRYYARTGAPRDSMSIDPRSRRIFDNGTKTHERLQGYMLDQGMLLMDEVPVLNPPHTIQGHTDGVLKLAEKDGVVTEVAILEIKSINSKGFASLKDAKEEHKKQGLVYVYCLEERRKRLHELYTTREQFEKDKDHRLKEYASFYQHLKSGSRYTRRQKIHLQCSLHDKMDNILFDLLKPITTTVFLYENKDTQDLKEFPVSITDPSAHAIITEVLEECTVLDEYIYEGKVPPRCASCKSDMACRWCNYRTECWN